MTKERLVELLKEVMTVSHEYAEQRDDVPTGALLADAVFLIAVATRETELEIEPEEFAAIMDTGSQGGVR